MSTNRELANIFREMARMLELEGVEWKPRAYLQAAYGIEDLSHDVKEIYEKGGKKALKEIPGVGESISDHIIEYIEKGGSRSSRCLERSIPRGSRPDRYRRHRPQDSPETGRLSQDILPGRFGESCQGAQDQ